MITEEHLKWLAPRAREDYVEAMTVDGGQETLRHFGIFESQRRFVAFFANVMHETGGLTIYKENLNYTSVARIRAVWPARTRSKSDSYLAGLVRRPPALAEFSYGGRMGNRPGTPEQIAAGTNDAYVFAGTGPLQGTGRDHMKELAAHFGVDLDEHMEYMESAHFTLMLSCLEWYQGGCNEMADAGNFDGTCAKINTGSATNIRGTNGLDDRRRWKGRVQTLLGQKPGIMELPAALLEEPNPEGDTVPGQIANWTETDEEFVGLNTTAVA